MKLSIDHTVKKKKILKVNMNLSRGHDFTGWEPLVLNDANVVLMNESIIIICMRYIYAQQPRAVYINF